MNSLPNEILLQIFEDLGYWDLKIRLPRVCKRFNAIISDPGRRKKIDKLLFRDAPQQPVSEYTVHPAFAELRRRPMPSLKDVLFLHGPGCEAIALTDTSVAEENAVSPAVECLTIIHGLGLDRIHVRATEEGKGVTVLDVMKALVNGGVYHRHSWDGVRKVREEDGAVKLYITYPMYPIGAQIFL